MPALASNIYGIHDAVIPNLSAFLHEVNNVDDLAKKMLILLKNKKIC